MTRKYKVNEINLEVRDIEPFENNSYTGFTIKWDSDIEFGEYTIYKAIDSNEWFADSEYMDSNKDKDFIKELMRLFIESLVIMK